MIAALFAAAVAAASPVEIVRQLLDGWRSADAAEASATFAPEFRLLTLREDGGGVRLDVDDKAHLMQSMKALKAGAWDVRPADMQVHEDATGIATVWAPYTFYISGKKSHCGVEAYTLYRLNEGWRIVEFADTHLWNGSEAECMDRPPVR